MAKKNSEFDFEKALKELESLVERMETGDMSLEDSLKYFERGVALTRSCQKALTEAEQKVQILLNEQGDETLAEFPEAKSDDKEE
ncbi:MAG: exodeoxyribonuclease VII small subunit [Gammaproteobacteria bacterium]